MAERYVSDTERFDLLDEWARRRDPDDVEAGLHERPELRAEQQSKADVGRCHMSQQRLGSSCAVSVPDQYVLPANRLRLINWRTSSSSLIPPATLRSKKRRPSSTWMGERARRYGSV